MRDVGRHAEVAARLGGCALHSNPHPSNPLTDELTGQLTQNLPSILCLKVERVVATRASTAAASVGGQECLVKWRGLDYDR